MGWELNGLGSTKTRNASIDHSKLLMAHILSNKMLQEGYRVPVTQLSICNQNYAAGFKSAWATEFGLSTNASRRSPASIAIAANDSRY